jgi:hypothetical protein
MKRIFPFVSLSLLVSVTLSSSNVFAQRAALATRLQVLIPEVRTANAIGLMSGPQANQLISLINQMIAALQSP